MKIGDKFTFKGFEWVVLDEHDFNGEKAVTVSAIMEVFEERMKEYE